MAHSLQLPIPVTNTGVPSGEGRRTGRENGSKTVQFTQLTNASCPAALGPHPISLGQSITQDTLTEHSLLMTKDT